MTNKVKEVVVTVDGTPLTIMERPEGLGTFKDYERKVQKYREQFGHIINSQSLDDYLNERREEAIREWDQ